MVNWKFFGEWIVNTYPAKRYEPMQKKLFDKLCETDKKLLLEQDKDMVFWCNVLFNNWNSRNNFIEVGA